MQNTIAEKNIFSKPRWHSNDWIIFGTSYGNIFKIKSDGSNLTQLTNTGRLFHPIWNPDGTKFVAFFSGKNQKSYILSDKGIVLDSIPIDVKRSSSWNNNFIAMNKSFVIEMFDIETKSLYRKYQYTEVDDFSLDGSTIWLNDSVLIWSSASGIKFGDIQFNNINNLWYSCSSRGYHSGDISPDKERMVWWRKTSIAIDEFNATVKNELVFIDIDGTKETVLDLP